jgi:hypothetical protein
MIEDQTILGLAVVSGGLLALIILLYWFVICLSLYRHGARFPTGLVPWRFVRDVRAYKEIIVANGDFPFYYYMIWILTWLLVVVLFILVVLSWQHYNETSFSRHRSQ